MAFFFFFKCFLATRPIPQSRRYKSRRPVQLSGTETPRSRQQEGIKLEWPSQEKSRPSQSVHSWFVVCAVHREAFPNSPKSFFNQVMFCSFNMWSIIHLPAFFSAFKKQHEEERQILHESALRQQDKTESCNALPSISTWQH